MHRRSILTVLLCLLTTLSAGAQGSREEIELLTIEGTTAIFSTEWFSNNKKDAVQNSCIAVLRRLLYDGIKDFNQGSPIVSSGQGTNLWLNEFFTGKYPTYKNFVGGVELVGDFDETPTGEIHCRTNVIIRYDQLMDQARVQGVTGSQQSPPQQTPAPQEKKPKSKKSFL
jgi:hypothetical protein